MNNFQDEMLVYPGDFSAVLAEQPDVLFNALGVETFPMGAFLAPPVANADLDSGVKDQGVSGTTIERGMSSDQDSEDRKIALRRENQRKYLQRRKQKVNDTEKTLQDAVRQKEYLKMEQEQLVKHSHGLEKMREYMDHVVGHFSDMIASARQTVGNAVTSGQDWISLMDAGPVFPDKYTDSHIINYVKSVSWDQLLVAREKSYRDLCHFLDLWHSNPGKRPAIENKISRLLDLRFRVLNFIQKERPELLSGILSGLVLPLGDDSSPIPGVNPVLVHLVGEADITPKQRAQVQAVWQEYTASIEAARAEVATASIDASMASSTGGNLFSLTPESLSRAAQDYLSILEAVSKLTMNSEAEFRAVLNLALSCNRIFNVVQKATIMKHCFPHMVDPVQLFQAILGTPIQSAQPLPAKAGRDHQPPGGMLSPIPRADSDVGMMYTEGSGSGSIDGCHFVATANLSSPASSGLGYMTSSDEPFQST